jgi:hypothetical protein
VPREEHRLANHRQSMYDYARYVVQVKLQNHFSKSVDHPLL